MTSVTTQLPDILHINDDNSLEIGTLKKDLILHNMESMSANDMNSLLSTESMSNAIMSCLHAQWYTKDDIHPMVESAPSKVVATHPPIDIRGSENPVQVGRWTYAVMTGDSSNIGGMFGSYGQQVRAYVMVYLHPPVAINGYRMGYGSNRAWEVYGSSDQMSWTLLTVGGPVSGSSVEFQNDTPYAAYKLALVNSDNQSAPSFGDDKPSFGDDKSSFGNDVTSVHEASESVFVSHFAFVERRRCCDVNEWLRRHAFDSIVYRYVPRSFVVMSGDVEITNSTNMVSMMFNALKGAVTNNEENLRVQVYEQDPERMSGGELFRVGDEFRFVTRFVFGENSTIIRGRMFSGLNVVPSPCVIEFRVRVG